MVLQKFLEKEQNRQHPVYASLELTTQCNARCDYCFIDFSMSSQPMPGKRWIEIIDTLYDNGVLFLHFTGGEIFLHPDVEMILEHACKRDFFRIIVYSNGTTLTEDHHAFLKKYSKFITLFQVSIFSHHHNIHDAYTKIDGGLSRILYNTERLRGYGITTSALVNLFPFNIDEMISTKEWLTKQGFTVFFGLTKIKPHNDNNSNQTQEALSVDFFKKYFTYAGTNSIQQELHKCKTNPQKANPNSPLCIGLSHSVTIGSQGEIFPCNIFRNVSYGSIFSKSSLQETLKESSQLNRLKSLTSASFLKCMECENAQYCVICPGLMHNEHGDVFLPPAYSCNYAKALGSFDK